MAPEKDHPGIFVPPPLIYAAVFVSAIFIQSGWAIESQVFHLALTKVAGGILILVAVCFFLFRVKKQS